MKISIIQSDIIWEDKSANLKKIENLIFPLYNNMDLIILPETFNTGFSMNPQKLAEEVPGETFYWMKNMAYSGGFGICGSYIVKENNNYFNRWLFVAPNGDFHIYDKRHLFSMGGEGKMFTRGNSRIVFKFRDMRISPFICYDLRFPVWSRNRNDCDLIIYSANWPEARRDVWNTLLKARAIENQCYAAGSNIIGTDGEGIKYCGESVIIGPKGEIIASEEINKESVITAEISIAELNDFRKKFPVSIDADNFKIVN